MVLKRCPSPSGIVARIVFVIIAVVALHTLYKMSNNNNHNNNNSDSNSNDDEVTRRVLSQWDPVPQMICPKHPHEHYTAAEVAAHRSKADVWIVLRGHVLNVTDFLPHHPGGEYLLQAAGTGRDEIVLFSQHHNPVAVGPMLDNFCIGKLKL